MSVYLDPESYDRAEEAGSAALPNRVVECCQPVGFLYEGYPTRVRSQKAVGRYVDVMHEGRLAGTFSQILGGAVTDDEMALMGEVARLVRRLTQEHYGRPMVPKDALARSLNIYRHIRFLYPDGKAVILEIGGGSGYVGAMLLLTGYSYVATDVSQAFYLFQNHLMNAIVPGRVIELATDPRSFADVKEIQGGWAVHVPWWKFVGPQPNFPLAVDLVTANHCLCEMHPRALAYTLKTCAGLLANRGPETYFLFEGWGSTTRNPIWLVNKNFSEQGFTIAHNDVLASVYVLASSPLAVSGATFPKVVPPPASDFSPTPARSGFLSRWLPKPGSLGPNPVLASGPTMEDLWHPVIWVTSSNPVSKKLTEGRANLARDARYGVEEFQAMLRKVLGSDDLLTDDEKFLHYINTTL